MHTVKTEHRLTDYLYLFLHLPSSFLPQHLSISAHKHTHTKRERYRQGLSLSPLLAWLLTLLKSKVSIIDTHDWEITYLLYPSISIFLLDVYRTNSLFLLPSSSSPLLLLLPSIYPSPALHAQQYHYLTTSRICWLISYFLHFAWMMMMMHDDEIEE